MAKFSPESAALMSLRPREVHNDMVRAIWHDAVIAESDACETVEGNKYFHQQPWKKRVCITPSTTHTESASERNGELLRCVRRWNGMNEGKCRLATVRGPKEIVTCVATYPGLCRAQAGRAGGAPAFGMVLPQLGKRA